MVFFLGCSSSFVSFPIEDIPQVKDKTIIHYSLPQNTEVVLDVTYKKEEKIKGIFADKAYLLGLKNVITNNEETFSVEDIKINTQIEETSLKQYVIIANNDKFSINKDDNGIIKSIIYNQKHCKKTPCFQKERDNCSKHSCEKGKCRGKINNQEGKTESLTPKKIFEEVLIEKNQLEKLNLSAEEVVEKIGKLREKQLEILSGELEGTYINTTLDYMYKQIDEIIDGYVSLFTGKTIIGKEKRQFTLVPQKPIIEKEALVIPLQGSPIPIMVSFKANDQIKLTKNEYIDSTNKDKGVKGVYYALPQMVKVEIKTPKKTFSQYISLNQYGEIVPMIIKEKNIFFNCQTGEIKKIN
jgi:hypothetical protein